MKEWQKVKRKENANKKQGTEIKRKIFEIREDYRNSTKAEKTKLKFTSGTVKNTIAIFKH